MISYDIDRLEKTVLTADRKLETITKEELYADMNVVMQESLLEVPRKTGTLASSAYVTAIQNGVVFGYGNDKNLYNSAKGQFVDEYKVAVHERLDVSHPTGNAKFLENPVNRYIATRKLSLAKRIFRKVFG